METMTRPLAKPLRPWPLIVRTGWNEIRRALAATAVADFCNGSGSCMEVTGTVGTVGSRHLRTRVLFVIGNNRRRRCGLGPK